MDEYQQELLCNDVQTEDKTIRNEKYLGSLEPRVPIGNFLRYSETQEA